MMEYLPEVGTIEWLYISLFIFWMTYLYFVKDYGYWEQRKIPHVPAVFPFGSLTKVVIGTNYDETMLDKIYKDFHDQRFVGFINIREPCLLLRDPELIKNVMSDYFENFVDRGWLDLNPKDNLLMNLTSINGEKWREMRDKLTPVYDAAHVYAMFDLFWKSSMHLKLAVEKEIADGNVLDVKEVVSQYTMRLFAACAFGTDIDSSSKEDEEFYKICEKLLTTDFKIKLKLYIYFAFPIVSYCHLFDLTDSKITEAFRRKIQATVKFRESTNTQKSDFINLLIKVRQNEIILGSRRSFLKPQEHSDFPGKEDLSIEEVIAETTNFFTMGHEKTYVIIQFCLYELACNEAIQERLFQEIQEVLEKHNNHLKCYTALDGMIYLDQVVNETLRHYPVFSTNYRKCTRDFKVPNSDLVIEKGLRLMIPLYSIHHDSKYFPEPYTFNPDRFSAENCQKRHPWAFLPFGIGPRKCIGYRFGVMTVKMAVARLVHNFHIRLTPDTPVPLQFTNKSYLTKPLKPIKLIFTKR